MPEIALDAEARADRGSPASRRLRATGRVPAVIYGGGIEPIPVSVDERALRSVLSTAAGENALINLAVGRQHHLTLARELQRHPVRDTLAHVDFVIVRRDEVVSADVPVVLTGEALAVTRSGGTVEQILFTLPVRAKPADIPHAIELDVTDLEIGATIRLQAASVPDGVTIEGDAETPVVAGHAARVEAAPAAEAGEEAAEAAEAGAETPPPEEEQPAGATEPSPDEPVGG